MDKGANSREVASHQFVADEDGIDAGAAKDAGIVGAKVELAGPQIVGLARCGLSGAGIEQGYEWYSVFGFCGGIFVEVYTLAAGGIHGILYEGPQQGVLGCAAVAAVVAGILGEGDAGHNLEVGLKQSFRLRDEVVAH